MEQHNSSINSSTGSDYDDLLAIDLKFLDFLSKLNFAESLFIWFISAIEIPIMFLALFALCFLIKTHRAASVYVSHLILSDFIQIICMLITTIKWSFKLQNAYFYCFIVGLYFMACVALERYLLVSHPHWYKSHHSLKLSCFIALIIWFVPLIFADIDLSDLHFRDLNMCIACFIPYPIIIFCFVGTCRGLSQTISLTFLRRRLILGSLFLVLLTYTCLILPFVTLTFIKEIFHIRFSLLHFKAYWFLRYLLYLNPLADCLLYLFMRSDAGDIMKTVHCCCKTESSKHNQDSVIKSHNSCATSVCCTSVQMPPSLSLTTCNSV